MKRIVLILTALVLGAAAQAQVVLGLQGGYFQQNSIDPARFVRFGDTHNENTYLDTVVLSAKHVNLLGGLQVGYMVTPKLYVGIMAGYISQSADTAMTRDFLRVDQRAHSAYTGMWETVNDHRFQNTRSGWTLAPQVKYEFARYGNMHFHLLLQGDIFSLGYSTVTESYRKPFENNNELEEFDPVLDSISFFSWGVSLRPTLTYEFSQHLSAELSLDFLSVGYVNEKTRYEGTTNILGSNGQTVELAIAPHDVTTKTLYAGLNTLMRSFQWESPLLRLGFNWKF